MAQNFAPLLDSLLGVVLIGAGVAVHFRKRLLIREPRRRFLMRRRTLYRLGAVVLVAGGIGLLLEAWLIAGDPVEAETAATMPSVATTVAASPPEPVPVEQLAPVTRKTLLLFWGTPADDTPSTSRQPSPMPARWPTLLRRPCHGGCPVSAPSRSPSPRTNGSPS
jgi:hypothetical protein